MSVRSNSQLALAALLCIHTTLLAWGAVVNSPTIDEVGWLPGGLASWKTGNLDVVFTNPPHVGLLAAIPLLFTDPDTTAFESGGSAHSIGREFIRTNGYHSFELFTLGRWACIPFSLLGAVTCFAWSRDLYGPRSGLLAATLWCFSPNILAHGQIVSFDVPATSMGLVANYTFWRWLRHSNMKNTFTSGLVLGLSLLTKMTILIYFMLWPLIWIAWSFGRGGNRLSHLVIEGTKLAAILVIALDVLNLGYGFQGSFAQFKTYKLRSQSLTGIPNEPGNGLAESFIGDLPVPFPSAYMLGLEYQRLFMEGKVGGPGGSYLRGEWSSEPLPYYYLYALAIKVPLGIWSLLLLSAIFRTWCIDAENHTRDELVLLIPAFAILVIASTSTAYNTHLRFVLPCFPFLFIWISRLANLSLSAHRYIATLGIVAAAWAVLSSLWVYPHSMSYFNEFVGGPRFGHYHLLGSNVDYGQDLHHLKLWYDEHPEARPLGLAYWDLESVDPRMVGIQFFIPPSGPAPDESIEQSKGLQMGPHPGWYAVNVNLLHADHVPARIQYPEVGFYGYFLEFSPIGRAGYSILIYHISLEEANRVRSQRGMPLLPSET